MNAAICLSLSSWESLLAAIISTVRSESIVIVGIFDGDQALDAAGKQLPVEGIENAVYDETIVAEPIGEDSAGPIPSPPDRILSAITRRLSDSRGLVQEFECRLSDCRLPDDAIEADAITFSRKGKFVLVESDASHADRATEILRAPTASRINRHD
jgi:hypothetical protein